MVLFYDTFHRRPRMAVACSIARVKRELFADVPIAECFNQGGDRKELAAFGSKLRATAPDVVID